MFVTYCEQPSLCSAMSVQFPVDPMDSTRGIRVVYKVNGMPYAAHCCSGWMLPYSIHVCSPTATKLSAQFPYAVLYDLHCEPSTTVNKPVSAYEWPHDTVKGAATYTTPSTPPPAPHPQHPTPPTYKLRCTLLSVVCCACSAVALPVCLLSRHWQWSVSALQL